MKIATLANLFLLSVLLTQTCQAHGDLSEREAIDAINALGLGLNDHHHISATQIANGKVVVTISHSDDSETVSKAMEYAGKIPNLDTLNVYSCATDADLAHLSSLRNVEHLTLQNANVTDAGMRHIEGFSRLKELDLSRTNLTDECIRHIAKIGASLNTLYLSETQISGEGGDWQNFDDLTSLEVLDLSNTPFTDVGIRKLGGSSVEELWLDDTKLAGSGLEQMHHLTKLKTLGLSGTEIQFSDLYKLRVMTHLETLIPPFRLSREQKFMLCLSIPDLIIGH